MPPSVDSTCTTPSACLARSIPNKRNSCSSKVLTKDLRKKSRGSSFLSETSPQRSDNLDLMGQLTQESQRGRSNPDSDAYVHQDLPSGRSQQGYFTLAQKNDVCLKRATFGEEERLGTEDLDGSSVKSMIMHSASLARSILVAYEKERDQEIHGGAIITELAWLRTFHEDATMELSQLRISNETAAADVASLQLKNANLAEKEAAASSKLDELQRQSAMRHAVNIVAAFVMSKALMLHELAESDMAGRSELDQLRFENAQIIKDTRETEEKRRMQILNLQTSLAAAEKEVAKLRSEKAELMKEKDEREAEIISEVHDMLYRLEAANEEVKQVRLSTEALLREKNEAAARAAQAAAAELETIQSYNETLLRKMQTAREIADAEIERMKSTLESTTASLKVVFLEKEEIAREKVESESRTKMEITQLQSEKSALVAEQEKTSATAAREFKRLSSRSENAVERLETIRHAAGLEKANFQSEMKAKNSELAGLKKKLVEVQAEMATRDAQRATYVQRLSREKEEGLAREAALLDKLQAITFLPRPHAEMHLAFLINCGLIRPEDYSLSFMPHSRS